MKNSSIRRAKRALSNAQATTPVDASPYEMHLSPRVCAALEQITVRRERECVVTEEGFVTMAVHPALAVVERECTALPGVDDQNIRGWLVFGAGPRAFHSQAINPTVACAEARIAASRALRIEAYFGGDKSKLAAAASSARAWRLVTLADAARAGLCTWGTQSFLQRTRTGFLIRLVGGVPAFLLKRAGAYGRRAIAASLIREATPARAAATSTAAVTTQVVTLTVR